MRKREAECGRFFQKADYEGEEQAIGAKPRLHSFQLPAHLAGGN